MYALSIQQIKGPHMFNLLHYTVFSKDKTVRQKKKKAEMADHLIKRMTKPFSRIALLLFLIWTHMKNFPKNALTKTRID